MVEWEILSSKAPALAASLEAKLPPLGRPVQVPALDRYNPQRVGGTRLPRPRRRHISSSTRERVLTRAGNMCQWPACNVTEDLHLDHRWPFVRGGTHDEDNLQVLCREHNLRKSDRVLDGIQPPDRLRQADHLATLVEAATLVDPVDILAAACAQPVDPGTALIRYELAVDLIHHHQYSGSVVEILRDSGDIELLALSHWNPAVRLAKSAELPELAERGSRTAQLRLGLDNKTPEHLHAALESPIAFVAGQAELCLLQLGDASVSRKNDLLEKLLESRCRFVSALAAVDLYVLHEDASPGLHEEFLRRALGSPEPWIRALASLEVACVAYGIDSMVFDSVARRFRAHRDAAARDKVDQYLADDEPLDVA